MDVTLNVAFVPAHTVLFTGCWLITGNWPSNTVTLKVQVDELPHTSVAVTVTSVVPMENWLPDAGTEVIVTGPPQLSVAVGVKETATVQKPIGVVAVIFAGQVSTGAV